MTEASRRKGRARNRRTRRQARRTAPATLSHHLGEAAPLLERWKYITIGNQPQQRESVTSYAKVVTIVLDVLRVVQVFIDLFHKH
jgi:hypothetical protein